MIRWTITYPKTEGATFDHDYYRDKHIPAFAAALNRSDIEITRGIDGPEEATASVTFESVEAMRAVLASTNLKPLLDDLPNYSTITPKMQTSEIVS
ncbi:hypothetical protein FAIPA1_200090 [Frankia sp. AiPs1]|uniref:EthD family reductase n=1 Tax=Frankia sp. AiPa1 TaxID=573492 RepID=UPI00202AE5BA|nr:EthD family reductase [Frankia sp. AiPa1]MCL9761305.1 EthD family reductase [Frankia sp. AiPa1]